MYTLLMSKEMMVIALGLWIIAVRTLLGIPGSWQTFLFIVTGVALAVIGFLLRGEALGRARPGEPHSKKSSYSFIESLPDRPAGDTPLVHEQKEGITSLN